MALIALPELPSAPSAEARPAKRLRLGIALLWVGTLVAAGLVYRGGNGFAVLSVGMAACAATLLVAELWMRRVLSGDGWLATRGISGWQVVQLRDNVVASSVSSMWVGGDWLILRNGTARVMLSDTYEGAIEMIAEVAPQLTKVRMDAKTRRRLTGEGDEEEE